MRPIQPGSFSRLGLRVRQVLTSLIQSGSGRLGQGVLSSDIEVDILSTVTRLALSKPSWASILPWWKEK